MGLRGDTKAGEVADKGVGPVTVLQQAHLGVGKCHVERLLFPYVCQAVWQTRPGEMAKQRKG